MGLLTRHAEAWPPAPAATGLLYWIERDNEWTLLGKIL